MTRVLRDVSDASDALRPCVSRQYRRNHPRLFTTQGTPPNDPPTHRPISPTHPTLVVRTPAGGILAQRPAVSRTSARISNVFPRPHVATRRATTQGEGIELVPNNQNKNTNNKEETNRFAPPSPRVAYLFPCTRRAQSRWVPGRCRCADRVRRRSRHPPAGPGSSRLPRGPRPETQAAEGGGG